MFHRDKNAYYILIERKNLFTCSLERSKKDERSEETSFGSAMPAKQEMLRHGTWTCNCFRAAKFWLKRAQSVSSWLVYRLYSVVIDGWKRLWAASLICSHKNRESSKTIFLTGYHASCMCAHAWSLHLKPSKEKSCHSVGFHHKTGVFELECTRDCSHRVRV